MAQHPDYAASERQQIADLLVELGPDAPTCCEGWTTADLAAHLVVREGSLLSSAGILLPPLAGRTRHAMQEVLRTHGFLGVVGLFRTGPAGFSPWRIRRLDQAGNVLEFLVHHEDIRRAQPNWSPRELSADFENLLWSKLRNTGRMLFRRAAVGVLLARRPTGATVPARRGEPVAVLEGLPSELVLYGFGRRQVAQVDARGPENAISALVNTRLGL